MKKFWLTLMGILIYINVFKYKFFVSGQTVTAFPSLHLTTKTPRPASFVNLKQESLGNSTSQAGKKTPQMKTVTSNILSTEVSLIPSQEQISVTGLPSSYVSMYQGWISGSVKSAESTNRSKNVESTYGSPVLHSNSLKEHTSTISSIYSFMEQEIASTATQVIASSTESFINDLRHLSTSQAGVKSVISPRKDLTKSDLTDSQEKSADFNLQTSHFSTSKSAVFIDSNAITVLCKRQSKVFTKGSVSSANLPKTLPLIFDIRKTSEFKSSLSDFTFGRETQSVPDFRRLKNNSVISGISQAIILGGATSDKNNNITPRFISASRPSQIASTPFATFQSSHVASSLRASSTGGVKKLTTPLVRLPLTTQLITSWLLSQTTTQFNLSIKSYIFSISESREELFSVTRSPSYVTSDAMPIHSLLKASPGTSSVHILNATSYLQVQSADLKRLNTSVENTASPVTGIVTTKTEPALRRRSAALQFVSAAFTKDKQGTRTLTGHQTLISASVFPSSRKVILLFSISERPLSHIEYGTFSDFSSADDGINAFSSSFLPVSSLSYTSSSSSSSPSSSLLSLSLTSSHPKPTHKQQNGSTASATGFPKPVSSASKTQYQGRISTSQISLSPPGITPSSSWQSQFWNSHRINLSVIKSNVRPAISGSFAKHQSDFSKSSYSYFMSWNVMSHSAGLNITFVESIEGILPSSTSNDFKTGVSVVQSSFVSNVQVTAASDIISGVTNINYLTLFSTETASSTIAASSVSSKSHSQEQQQRRLENLSTTGNQIRFLSSPRSVSSTQPIALFSKSKSSLQNLQKRTTLAKSNIHEFSPRSFMTVQYFSESLLQSSVTSLSQASLRSSRPTSLPTKIQTVSPALSTNTITSPSISYSVSTYVHEETLKTSLAIEVTSREKLDPTVTVPSLLQSQKDVPMGTTVIATETAEFSTKEAEVTPTETSESLTTEDGDTNTGQPATATTKSDHVRLLVIVATVPSVVLCVFFAAVLLFRRNRRRRNNFKYSIKLEYRDDNNGYHSRCVNSRLDLSLKGIHIDLEFPNSPPSRGYSRDSAVYSRGPSMTDTSIRELQLLSQECKENLEWISEFIARDMETSLCGRGQPGNRESVYSVKEKGNYHPGEKISRRGSSKRGRESVKWKIPIVRRRDSVDFDQTDSMSTEVTALMDLKNANESVKGGQYSLVREDNSNDSSDVSIVHD